MSNTLADLFQLALITPRGEEHALNNLAEYTAEGSDGFGMPPVRRLTQRYAGRHGEADQGFRLEPRRLRFRLKAHAADPAAYYTRRAELLRLFCPAEAPLRLRLILPENLGTRQIDCYFTGGLGYASAGRNGLVQETEMILTAPDPTFYDPAQKQAAWDFEIQDGLVFPITFPVVLGSGSFSQEIEITYAGSWRACPVIVLLGPLEHPRVLHTETGERLYLEYTLRAGEEVVIDCREENRTVTNNFGENLLHYLSPDSDLGSFHLDPDLPGGINHLIAAGGGAAVGLSLVRVCWHDRFVGV